jgi:hypothetical protein
MELSQYCVAPPAASQQHAAYSNHWRKQHEPVLNPIYAFQCIFVFNKHIWILLSYREWELRLTSAAFFIVSVHHAFLFEIEWKRESSLALKGSLLSRGVSHTKRVYMYVLLWHDGWTSIYCEIFTGIWVHSMLVSGDQHDVMVLRKEDFVRVTRKSRYKRSSIKSVKEPSTT